MISNREYETLRKRAAEAEARVVEVENALSEIRRRTAMLIHQNTGRWSPGSVDHDKRTVDVLMGNQAIATAALDEVD